MSDQDIFTADKQTSTQVPQVNPLEVLVGEGKKYATAEDLAKAYLNADNFIETLKDENRSLREQSTKLDTLEAALEKLNAKNSSVEHHNEDENVPKNTLDAETVAKLIEQKLNESEQNKTIQGNLKLADAKFKEVFGDKAQAVYDEVASTPAMKQSLMTLAQQNPDEFVKFFINLKGQSTSSVQPQGGVGESTVNTVNLSSSFSNRSGDPETKEFYNVLRQKDPSKYYSQAVQIQMNNAAIKNPDKFFGRT